MSTTDLLYLGATRKYPTGKLNVSISEYPQFRVPRQRQQVSDICIVCVCMYVCTPTYTELTRIPDCCTQAKLIRQCSVLHYNSICVVALILQAIRRVSEADNQKRFIYVNI